MKIIHGRKLKNATTNVERSHDRRGFVFFRENKTSDRKTVNPVRFDLNSSFHFRFGIDYHNLALIV